MIHDTTINNDGPAYRSLIMYHQDNHLKAILAKIKKEQAKITDFSKKVETEVIKGLRFQQAEQEHQNYFQRNKDDQFCIHLIIPKFRLLKRNEKRIKNCKPIVEEQKPEIKMIREGLMKNIQTLEISNYKGAEVEVPTEELSFKVGTKVVNCFDS